MYNGTVCSYAGDLHRDAQTQALYPPCALRVAAVVTDTGARRALLCGGGGQGVRSYRHRRQACIALGWGGADCISYRHRRQAHIAVRGGGVQLQ